VGILAIAATVSAGFKGRRDAALATAAFVVLFNVGAIAAPVLAYQGFTSVSPSGNLDVALPDGSGCTIADRTEVFPGAGGEHTEKDFYAPGEEIPRANFGHSLADGYVIVLYPDTAPGADVSALREFVAARDPSGVIAGARGVSEAGMVAVTADQQMTCPNVQIGALRQFSRAWMDSIGAAA
jgi:hypothetical protein